jgi:Flp pilus assembly protein TadD
LAERRVRAGLHTAALSLLCLLQAACGALGLQQQVNVLQPLTIDGREITVRDARAAVRTPDLLAVDDEMRDFVELHTSHSWNLRNRLLSLHRAVKSPAILAIEYDPFADGDARSAFHRGSANCLSYAHLFVALAREAGLDARYQQIDVRPQWERMGDRVALRQHVNVLIRLPGGEEYMIDIDPLQRNEVAGTKILTDNEAAALYHSNMAMHDLAEDRPDEAWMQLVRALEWAPRLSQLWVNIGAVYRYVGQNDAAEQAYQLALTANNQDRSAMNNLAVLYRMTDRLDEEAFWLDRLHEHRENNPYYHAYLGDIAMEEEAWDEAFRHYLRAVKLQPDDSRLVYSLGLIEHRRGNRGEATRLINEAIDMANYRIDIEGYRIQLRAIEAQERAASL